ncbi:hypothetical protein [Stetteria hydrogenophila]
MLTRKRREINVRIAAVETLSIVRKALYRVRSSKRMVEAVYSRSGDPALRNLIESHVKLETILEAVALRLETIAALGMVTKEMVEAPLRVVKEALSLRKTLPPDVAGMVSELDEALTVMYEVAAPAEFYGLDPASYGDPSEEARRVLREAEVQARERMRKLGL